MAAIKTKKNKEVEIEKTLMQQVTDYILRMLVALYVLLLLVVFPYYMERKYLNMGDAKYHFFQVVSLAFLGAMILCLIFWVIAHRKDPLFEEKFGRLTQTEYFLFGFLVVSFISYICAYDKKTAFFGYNGWFMGLLSQTMFVLIFFFVSKFWGWSSGVIKLMMVSAAGVFLIAVLQRFDMDIFMLYQNIQADGTYRMLSDANIEKFVSTLGQTSWYSCYAVIMMPFGMFWYAYDTKMVSRILSAVFIIISGASLCTVNNDSAYIAIALIFMVFFWFALESNEQFLHLIEIVLLYLASFRLVGIFQTLFPERRIKLITGEEKITEFLNHSTAMLIISLVILGIYLALRFKFMKETEDGKKFDISKFKVLRKIMVYGAIVMIWLVVLLIILCTNNKMPDALSNIKNIGFFNFDLSWGNHRGFNWRMAIKALGKANIKDWLVGVGPDCFSTVMDMYFRDEVRTYWHGDQLACAHNEWLNMLVTQGILGLVAYTGIFVSIMIRLGKIVCKEKMAIPFMAAILAYVGYNIFCYQQCIGTPVVFIFMGISEMMCSYTEREVKEEA